MTWHRTDTPRWAAEGYRDLHLRSAHIKPCNLHQLQPRSGARCAIAGRVWKLMKASAVSCGGGVPKSRSSWPSAAQRAGRVWSKLVYLFAAGWGRDSARIPPTLPDLADVAPRCDANLANLDPTWPIWDNVWPNLAQLRQALANIGRCFGQLRPKCVHD